MSGERSESSLLRPQLIKTSYSLSDSSHTRGIRSISVYEEEEEEDSVYEHYPIVIRAVWSPGSPTRRVVRPDTQMLNYRNPTPNTKTKSQKQKNVRQYAWQPTYRLACASHAPASAAQAAYCAPQRHLPSFATERKLVRAQAATRARATPPAPQIRSAAAKHTTTTPSSRHECPCALLNTRWRVMRRGTDAPPLLRAPAAQSRQVRLWRKRPTPHAVPNL